MQLRNGKILSNNKPNNKPNNKKVVNEQININYYNNKKYISSFIRKQIKLVEIINKLTEIEVEFDKEVNLTRFYNEKIRLITEIYFNMNYYFDDIKVNPELIKITKEKAYEIMYELQYNSPKYTDRFSANILLDELNTFIKNTKKLDKI
jgi:hypothetical protein